MILGGMTPLYEGMRLHFKSNQEIAMDRSSFLREAASSNKNIQPTHNSARLFAHGFAIIAQTPRSAMFG
jgi:hypothetical protein